VQGIIPSLKCAVNDGNGRAREKISTKNSQYFAFKDFFLNQIFIGY
jgi:hypothetical protein